MSGGRQPDYSLGALDTSTDEKNPRIGAGWLNEDGTISISLNDFIVLRGSKTMYLRLFPRDKPPATGTSTTGTSGHLAKDIPF